MSLLRSGYYGLSWISSPLINAYLKYRQSKGKEDRLRLSERFGFPSQRRNDDRPLAWFHAVSVGEAVSALALIEFLKKKYPFLAILLTTSTYTSAKFVAKKLPKQVIHQYSPIDTPQAVNRFLAHWQPDLALLIESELWPNLLYKTQEQGIPVLLLNGRLSENSFKNWSYFSSLIRPLLERLSFCGVQSKRQKELFEALGVKKAEIMPNLKLLDKPKPLKKSSLDELKMDIGSRPVWFAASTHEGEEKIAIKLHQYLRKKIPSLLTIIAPRHVERAFDIIADFKDASLSYAQRSLGDRMTSDTDIYLVDTMGELNIFYSLSPITMMGATFIPKGGHNPIEAARCGTFIVHGEHTYKNASLYETLHQLHLARQCNTIFELEEEVLQRMTLPHPYAEEPKPLRDLRERGLKEILGHLSPFIASLQKQESDD